MPNSEVLELPLDVRESMIQLERLRKEFDKVWKEAVKGSDEAAAKVEGYVAANRKLVDTINSQTSAWHAQKAAIREAEAAARAHERAVISVQSMLLQNAERNRVQQTIGAAHLTNILENADTRDERAAIERIKEKAAWQLVEIRSSEEIAEQKRLENIEEGKGLILLQRRKELADRAEGTERIKEKLAWNAIEIRSQEELAEAKRVANIEDGRGINVIEQNIAKKAAAKAATDSYIASVNAAKAADANWNTAQGNLHIQFRTLTNEIEAHRAKIKELTQAEHINADAVEFEARALSLKQGQLIQVERQMANSNAAMRQGRLVTQSAAYAIQDFVQGLSVGSFSMAVRGAANNVETLAASLALGASNATFMALALAPTALLIGVSLAEAFSKRATPAVKESVDATRDYRQELERLQGVAANATESEHALANAVEHRSFATRRADMLAKLTKDEIAFASKYETPGLSGKGHSVREDEATVAKMRAEFAQYQANLKPGQVRLNWLQWANANNVRFGGAFNRLENARPELIRLAAQRDRINDLDDERNRAAERMAAQQALAKHRGKLVEQVHKLREGGAGRAGIEAQIANALAADPAIGKDVARRAAGQVVNEADQQLDRTPWKRADTAWKERIDVLEANRDRAKGRGKFAEREADKALESAKAQAEFWKRVADSQLGVMVEMKALLAQIAANTNDGQNGPPRNDFIRNNANVINPFQWIPGIGR